MKGFRKLIPILVAVVAFAALFAGCGPNGNGIELRDTAESYTMILNDTDVSQIRFEVWENGEKREELRASEEMFSETDLAKLNSVGQYVLSLHYENQTLFVTVTVRLRSVEEEFDAVFYAGEGAFDEEGTSTWTVRTVQGLLETMPPAPVREGYTFYGWYDNPRFEGNRLVSVQGSRLVLHSDMEYYAKWRDVRTYTVTFRNARTGENIKVNGQSALTDVEYGTIIIPPEPPVEDTYRFTGWFLRVETEAGKWEYESWDPTKPVTSNLDVYAVYEEQFYFVTFYEEDGTTVYATRKVRAGESFSRTEFPEVPKKSGYTGEWRMKGDIGLYPQDSYTNLRNDIDIIAVYTPIYYTYTFHFTPDSSSVIKDLGGKPVPADKVVSGLTYGEKFPTPPQPESVAGYDGTWYYLGISGRYEPANSFWTDPVTDDMEFYAHYEYHEYTIVFQNSGTTLKELKKHYLETVSESEFPSVPYDSKRQSIDWYFNSTLTGDPIGSTFVVDRTGNDVIYVYLKITELPRRVDFVMPASIKSDSGGGEMPIEEDFISRHGYEKTADNKYLVIQSITAPHKTLVSVPILEDPKYEITDWKYASTGESVPRSGGINFLLNDFYEVDDPTTLGPIVAEVQIRSYSVTFYRPLDDFSGYTSMEEQTKKYGETIDEPEDPTPPKHPVDGRGYTFGGWYDNPLLQGAQIDFTKTVEVTGAMRFYPRWYDPEAGSQGLEYRWFSEGGESGYYEVIGYKGTDTDIHIPQYYTPQSEGPNGAVKAILKGALSNKNLTGTAAPNTVELYLDTLTKIEDGAFDDLYLLEEIKDVGKAGSAERFCISNGILYRILSTTEWELIVCPARNKTITDWNITLPGQVARISMNAFVGATELLSVTISKTGAVNNVEISDYAFKGAEKLQSVDFGDKLTGIGKQAFRGCYALATITFDASNLLAVHADAFTETKWYDEQKKSAGESAAVVLNGVLIDYLGRSDTFEVPDEVTIVATGALDADEDADYDKLVAVRFKTTSQLRLICDYAFRGGHALYRFYILCGNDVSLSEHAFDMVRAEPELYVSTGRQDYYKDDAVANKVFGEDRIQSA